LQKQCANVFHKNILFPIFNSIFLDSDVS